MRRPTRPHRRPHPGRHPCASHVRLIAGPRHGPAVAVGHRRLLAALADLLATSTRPPPPPPPPSQCSRLLPTHSPSSHPGRRGIRTQAPLSDATLQTSHEAAPFPDRASRATIVSPTATQPRRIASGVTATQARTETRGTQTTEQRLLANLISPPLNLDCLSVWAQVPP